MHNEPFPAYPPMVAAAMAAADAYGQRRREAARGRPDLPAVAS